jgi:hypothetical protein
LLSRFFAGGVRAWQGVAEAAELGGTRRTKATMAKNGNGNGKTLDLPALENWLREAACIIRGPLDAPKYKDYILPLVFLKRLSDVFDEEVG